MKILDTINQALTTVNNVLDIVKSKKKEKEVDEYTKQKVNEVVNDNLNNSMNTSLCDAVRKQKQQQIEELKNA